MKNQDSSILCKSMQQKNDAGFKTGVDRHLSDFGSSGRIHFKTA